MAFEQKDGSGALFKNTFKEEGSTQPDYRGDCNVGGQIMEIAAWLKPTAKGGKFMSLSFKPKEERFAGGAATPVKQESFDDDIPF